MGINIAIVAFTISCLFMIYGHKYFLKKGIIDPVNERSSHNSIATRSGGIAIYLTILVISIYHYLNQIEIFDYSLLVALSILLIVGLYDDLNEVDFKLKFLFEIITAKILIDNGLIIDNFYGMMGINELNRIFAQLFSIFIIVAIINSINFIDGIDGLAASILSLFIILFEFFAINQTQYSILSTILLTSFIPFIYFNIISKKKVFLGDSGSLFLGGIVSIYVIHIFSSEYLIKEEFDINKVLFVISILSYPIIDIIRIFFVRIYKGKSPFIADKNHIHHILLQRTRSHVLSVLILIMCSLALTLFIQILF